MERTPRSDARCASAPAERKQGGIGGGGGGGSSTTTLTQGTSKAFASAAAAAAASTPSAPSEQPPQQPVFCRICLDSDTEGLIAPCQCRGEAEREMRTSIFFPFSLDGVFFFFRSRFFLVFFPRVESQEFDSGAHTLTSDDFFYAINEIHLTGTQQYVHVQCLRKWQSVAGKRDGDGERDLVFSSFLS
jgi:hypothetical protein